MTDSVATELDLAGVKARYADVKARLEESTRRWGAWTELLAVSKTFPAEAVLAVAQCGQRDFGENYAQEGCDKVDWFRANHPEMRLTWHFIGPLQANKTRIVAEHFDWVESVDRIKIARRLNDQRPMTMDKLNVLIEVNIDGEETKSGVKPEALGGVLAAVSGMRNLRLRGLMAIPAPAETHDAKMAPLVRMRSLFDRYAERYGFDTLSMGMSADMAEAVEAGATQVRVGSAIFGARHYPAKAEA